MAENTTKNENTVIIASKEEEKRDDGLFGIFSKFHLNFPPTSIQETKVIAPGLTKNGDEESKAQKPESVKIPAVRKDFLVLKLEPEEPEQESNPGNMWQMNAVLGRVVSTAQELAHYHSGDEDGIYLAYSYFHPYLVGDSACTKELNQWFVKQFEMGPFQLVAEEGKAKCSWVTLDDSSNCLVRDR